MYETTMDRLKAGAKIHGFSSGGRVRVLRSDTEGLIGYGEDADINEAFDELEKNFKTGKKGIIYMTGGQPTTKFDAWVTYHSGYDITWNDKFQMVEIELNWIDFKGPPKNISETVMKLGVPIIAKDLYGATWQVSPFIFPGNGELGTSARVIDKPENYKNTENRSMKIGACDLERLIVALETCLPEVKH